MCDSFPPSDLLTLGDSLNMGVVSLISGGGEFSVGGIAVTLVLGALVTIYGSGGRVWAQVRV